MFSFFRTTIGKICLKMAIASFLAVSISYAADLTVTPVNLGAADESVLRSGITAAQTTITLEPIKKWVNGTRTTGCLDTTSGFAVIEDFKKSEWVSFGTKACNSSTFVTTLTDVRRGLNPTSPGFTAGTGIQWDAGARFRIIDWPVFYNNALYKDRINKFTGSGKVTGSGITTHATMTFNLATTSQRDAFDDVEDGDVYCNTTLNTCQYRMGSSWFSFGSGSIVNATLTSIGNVQISSTGSNFANTAIGSTGAENALSARYTTKAGGANKMGWIPTLSGSFTYSGLDESLLGTGTPSTSTYLRGNGTSAIASWSQLAASGAVIVANDNEQTDNTTLTSTTFAAIDGTNLSESISVAVGDVLLITFAGNANVTVGGGQGEIFLDTTIGGTNIGNSSGGYIRVEDDDVSPVIDHLITFTQLHQVTSAGTVTIQPVYKVSTGHTWNFKEPIYFQVMRFK